MSACEKCWRDASARVLFLGGSVSEHYRALLEERRDNPCSEQATEEPVSAAAVDPSATDPGKPTTRE
jgi:hypothetical protein